MKEIFQRMNQFMVCLVLAVVILHFGKIVLLPVAFAALLSMLMAPVSRFLERKGFNRSFATLTCVLMIFFAIVGVLAIVTGQIASFRKDYPQIKKKATTFVENARSYLEDRMGVDRKKQEQIAKQQQSKPGGGMSFVTKLLGGLTTTIGSIVLTLVYTFLMLYNKEQFEKFFLRLYGDEDKEKVQKIVNKIAEVSQKYLTGRLMSICIIFGLYAIGLTIVGIKNAILLAGVAAIMTLIPYLGTILGGLFPVMMALATEDSIQPAIWAGFVLFFIQTMDNYFIEPNIVGGEVNLSALTSIFSVIAGGLLWGPAGMIVFLPMAAIIKIICDHVEPLKPVGFILGEPGGKKPSKVKTWIREKLGLDKKTKRVEAKS